MVGGRAWSLLVVVAAVLWGAAPVGALAQDVPGPASASGSVVAVGAPSQPPDVQAGVTEAHVTTQTTDQSSEATTGSATPLTAGGTAVGQPAQSGSNSTATVTPGQSVQAPAAAVEVQAASGTTTGATVPTAAQTTATTATPTVTIGVTGSGDQQRDVLIHDARVTSKVVRRRRAITTMTAVRIGPQQPRAAATSAPAVSYAGGLVTVGSVSARSRSTTVDGRPQSSVDFRVRDLRVKERRDTDDALVQVIDARRTRTGKGMRVSVRLQPPDGPAVTGVVVVAQGRDILAARTYRSNPQLLDAFKRLAPALRKLAGTAGSPLKGLRIKLGKLRMDRSAATSSAAITAVTISVQGQVTPEGARPAFGLGGLVNVAIGTARSAVSVASSPVVRVVGVAGRFGGTAVGTLESGAAQAGRLFGLTTAISVTVHELQLRAGRILLPVSCKIDFDGSIALVAAATITALGTRLDDAGLRCHAGDQVHVRFELPTRVELALRDAMARAGGSVAVKLELLEPRSLSSRLRFPGDLRVLV
jgi:hypothetical protein